MECFLLPNSFSRTIALGVTSASNRNEYYEYSWGIERGRRKADNLTTICDPIVGSSMSHNIIGLHGPLQG
jgi:hypothetical protein